MVLNSLYEAVCHKIILERTFNSSQRTGATKAWTFTRGILRALTADETLSVLCTKE